MGGNIHLFLGEIFKSSETYKIIQYIFCLPGTNASTERVFSQMNKIWTADKTQLSVSTLKSLLLLKCNFKQSCLEFYNFLKSSPELLEENYIQ